MGSVFGAITLTVASTANTSAMAADDLLDNSASPDAGSSSFSIQTDKSTSKVWFQAHRFEATEDGDVEEISVQLEVDASKQNEAAAATYTRVFSNAGSNELDVDLATFAYDRHSLISSSGSRDDINVTYTGTASLAAGTYWLATYSSGDRDTDDESASLSYSSLSNQVYEGPWTWVSGAQNRYSQAITTSYLTVSVAPIVRIRGTRTNPPAPPAPAVEEPNTVVQGGFGLALTLPAGWTCQFPEETRQVDGWTRLPNATNCNRATPSASGVTEQLLGWATNAEFPVDIAERQVNNGWGAYETFNSTGQLTGVFIPAGGYTLISNDTNLYPIFSN